MSTRGENRLAHLGLTVALGLTAALAGCAPSGDQARPIRAPIVDGTLNTGDPAVVSFLAFKDNLESRCTATVISPRMLLTAGHCIADTSGFSYSVFPGPNDTQFTLADLLPVQTVAYDTLFDARDPSLGHDLGVVVLEAPISITPLRMNREALGDVIGHSARYVGYGRADPGSEASGGVKRSFSSPISQANDHYLRMAPNAHGACSGDSGGPLLMDLGAGEVIIGVVSFGDDANCGKSSFFQRLDTQIAYVDQQMRLWDPSFAPPLPDGGYVPPPPVDAALPPPALPEPPPPLPPDAASEVTAAPDAGAVAGPPAGSGGCAMAGGSSGGGTMLLVLVAGLCLNRRRRPFSLSR